MTHQRVYSAGLALFALFNAMLLIDGAMEMNLVGRGWEGSVGWVPSWAVPWLGLLLLAYTIGAVAVLIVRRREGKGRAATRVFNWFLLAAFPAGTMIGLYGLLKVDRKKFDLEEAMAVWRREIAAGGGVGSKPVEELEQRLREETSDQMWSWKSGSEERAFALAVQRLGEPARAVEIELTASARRARRGRSVFGWVAGGVVFPALTLGFLLGFDQIELGAGEQAAVSATVGLGVLLHFCMWRQLYRRLPQVTRKRALQTLLCGCAGLSSIFGLLTVCILLPGLNFSGHVSVATATELKSNIPSIPLWCLCYLAGMGCLTLGCGLEEAVAQVGQSSGNSGSGGVAPAQVQT